MDAGCLRRLAQARRRDDPRRRSALHPRGREGRPGHRGDRGRDPADRRDGPGRRRGRCRWHGDRPPARPPGESEPVVDAVVGSECERQSGAESGGRTAPRSRVAAARDRRRADAIRPRQSRRWRAGWRASWASTGRGWSAAAARAGSARLTFWPPHGLGIVGATRGPADRGEIDPDRTDSSDDRRADGPELAGDGPRDAAHHGRRDEPGEPPRRSTRRRHPRRASCPATWRSWSSWPR